MKQLNLVKNAVTFGTMILMATLVACGGGSSDGSSSNGNTNTESEPQTPVVVQPEEPIVITSTEDLVVADTFLFQSNYKLDVQVDLSSQYDYLTICYADDEGQPNYGDCLLRTGLDEGEVSSELLLTNDTRELLIVAWDYADVNNPAVSTWNRDLDGDLLQVN